MKSITQLTAVLFSLTLLTSFSSCNQKKDIPKTISYDLVYNSKLSDIRLGDGVPLDLSISVRWKIEDYESFSNQFSSPDDFDTLVLESREMELANSVANDFLNVDSVFTSQRHKFIGQLKQRLLNELGEPGIAIKEVIISDLKFPISYTGAMEQLAMQDRELERIRKQSVIDLEKSIAAKQQAEEDGKVAMAKAEMNAKVQNINAETEKSIRQNRLAQAETEKQVSKLQAQAQAEKQQLLAEADVKRKRAFNQLEIENQKEADALAVQKQKDLDALVFNQDMQMAKLCMENPAYANYMVNKELASKVQIAVLPSTGDASVFSGLLNQGMAQK